MIMFVLSDKTVHVFGIFCHINKQNKCWKRWLSAPPVCQEKSLLEYVHALHECLRLKREMAHKAVSSSQGDMKEQYDRKGVPCSFCAGDQVLALLPMHGSSLQARFVGLMR